MMRSLRSFSSSDLLQSIRQALHSNISILRASESRYHYSSLVSTPQLPEAILLIIVPLHNKTSFSICSVLQHIYYRRIYLRSILAMQQMNLTLFSVLEYVCMIMRKTCLYSQCLEPPEMIQVLRYCKKVSDAVAHFLLMICFACIQSRDLVINRAYPHIKAHQRMTIKMMPSTTSPDVKLKVHTISAKLSFRHKKHSIQH